MSHVVHVRSNVCQEAGFSSWGCAAARAAATLVILAIAAVAVPAQAVPPELVAARAAVAARHPGVALAAYDRHLAANPTDAAILREAGRVALETRRFDVAAAYFSRRVELEPDVESAYYDLAATRSNQCRWELALPVLRRMESLESTNAELARRPEHRYLHGQCALALNISGEAIAEHELAVARTVENSGARLTYLRGLAESYVDGGNFTRAAAIFGDLARLDPRSMYFRGLGIALAETGKIDEAIAALREARRRDANDVETLTRLGNFALRQRQLLPAESYLLEAVRISPQYLEALSGLAQVYRLQGRTAEADATKKRADEIKPKKEDADERNRKYFRAITSNPEDLKAHVDHGQFLLEVSSFDTAERVWSRVLSFAPHHAIAILNLSLLLAKRNDTASAELELSKLTEVDPTEPRANVLLARLRVMKRDYAGAEAIALAALAAHPADSDLLRLLAGLADARGDKATGAEYRGRIPNESRPASQSQPAQPPR